MHETVIKSILDNQIVMWQAPKMQLAGVRHAFFGRTGGFSKGEYDSLNFSRGDEEKNRILNLRRVASILELQEDRIKLVNQNHSNSVISVTQDNTHQSTSEIEADGIVTHVPGIALAVTTADCCPILLCDTKAQVIAAVHAGWRGALASIIPNAVATMVSLGASTSNIQAAIGPSIGQNSYEVGEEFYLQFISQNTQNQRFFTKNNDRQTWYFDLKAYVASSLRTSGVRQIEDLAVNTYTEPQHLFSCRRSAHQGKQRFGCQISLITLSTTNQL
jgi:YfiH family protein